MKIKDLENLDYKNSSVTITEEIAKSMSTIMTENKEVIENYSSVKLKVKDHSHFLNILTYIPKDTSFILEDDNQKYIVTGDFADKV